MRNAWNILIDPQTAGVSGDMLLGALFDLGADVDKVQQAIDEAPKHLAGCKSIEIKVKDVHRYGIRATKVSVQADESYHGRPGGQLLKALAKCLDKANVDVKARTVAMNALHSICKTEANLHSSTPDKVELHEMGSVDTIVDIGGVAVALNDLSLTPNGRFYSLPINVGLGKISTSHGILSAPTLDATEILKSKKFPFEIGTSGGELATPTGITILAHLAEPVFPGLQIKPEKIGYGAGTKELDFAPNILRIVIGKRLEPEFVRDNVLVLETNLDDVKGEVVGYLIEKLMKHGARDAWATSAITKKNRPSLVLSIIGDESNISDLAKIVFEETGTLGIRIHNNERFVLERKQIPVKVRINNHIYTVPVKAAYDNRGHRIGIKAEYEDAAKIAKESNQPLRLVIDAIHKQAEEKIPK
ncbi:MAG: nickel pincer cofactor biosynthesis protein LarC [Candidatus Bathyarchaeia archaeon]